MDAGAVYFYVETAAPLTRNTDPGWMLLLVDADDDTSTGWCGYDFIVNYHIPYPDRSAVMAWDAESKKWIPAGYVALGVSGCRMELALPRTLLGEAACRPEGSILFKWVDNPSGLDNMIDLCTAGDTAPNRRFNYRYSWSGNSAVPVAVDTVDVPIKAEGVSGGIAISGDGRYSVADTCGRQVASGMCRGQVFIDIQTPGFYIVSAGGTTDKIVVK